MCPQTSSTTLQDSLRKIYTDMFQFFQGVARIFSSADGSKTALRDIFCRLMTFPELKRTPIVVGNLMWKPFDIRFHDLLEDMDHHREVVKLQLLIMVRDAQMESAGKAERESHFAAAERHNAKSDREKSKEMEAYMEKILNQGEKTKGLLEKQYQGQSLGLLLLLPASHLFHVINRLTCS